MSSGHQPAPPPHPPEDLPSFTLILTEQVTDHSASLFGSGVLDLVWE